MHEWKRERATPSKPVGPSKKQLDALLAELRELSSEMYAYGMAFLNRQDTTFAVLAGAHTQVLAAVKAVEDALYFGERHGTLVRAAHLAKEANTFASTIDSTRSMIAAGWYDAQRWYFNGPWHIHKAYKVGCVDGAREMLDKLATIGVLPAEKKEEAA